MAKKEETAETTTEATSVPLVAVTELAAHAGLPAWELAALMRSARWAEGKHLTQAEFDTALAALRNRPMGGGQIGR